MSVARPPEAAHAEALLPDGVGNPAEAVAGDGVGALLALLQYGDSAFPSGASAFSWGLESLLADGLVQDATQLVAVLRTWVEQRWAGFDRPLIRAAHQAAGEAMASEGGEPAATPDWRALIAIDQLCEAMTLNQGARAASCRLGFTQLRVQGELGLPAAAHYLDVVRAGHAPGHLPVAQGLVWRGLGLALAQAEAMAAQAQCIAVAGAAIRLGLVGHVQAQRVLLDLRRPIEAVLAHTPPALEALWSGAPALDIAAMRHETRAARLFAN